MIDRVPMMHRTKCENGVSTLHLNWIAGEILPQLNKHISQNTLCFTILTLPL